MIENAVWIQDSAQGTIPADKANILTTNLAGCVSDCAGSYIKRVFIQVGYWHTDQTVGNWSDTSYGTDSKLKHTIAQYQAINAAFHAAGIKTYAWVEGSISSATVNVANPTPLLSEIARIVSYGFDGWADDVEMYQGTQAQYISYLNSIPENYPALSNDPNHSIYPNLYTKALVPMFYGASQSRFELPDAPAYWANIFYNPKVPVILGMMNRPASATHTFPWNLDQCRLFVQSYPHMNLVGVSIYLYEHMSSSDWAYWRTWVESFSTLTYLSEPDGISATVNGASLRSGGVLEVGRGSTVIISSPKVFGY